MQDIKFPSFWLPTGEDIWEHRLENIEFFLYVHLGLPAPKTNRDERSVQKNVQINTELARRL